MEAKKQRRSILLRALICLAIVAVLIAGIFTAKYIAAKYTSTYKMNGSVYVQKSLDLDIFIYEHDAVLQSDGTYLLMTDGESVQGNTYNVLPGVDIPKDPCIYLENLSDTSFYIYVEVVDQLIDSALTYAMEDYWLQLDITGLNGGTVYVYSEDGINPTLVNGSSEDLGYNKTDATTNSEVTTHAVDYDLTINIIKDQTVSVGAGYQGTIDGILNFYGYAAEASEGDDPIQVFQNSFTEND